MTTTTTEYKPIILHVAHGAVTGSVSSTGAAELSLHTSMDALVDGLRKMYRTDAASAELLTDLLAGLAGALERDAVYGSEVERLRALLAEQLARAERAEAILRDAWFFLQEDDHGLATPSYQAVIDRVRPYGTTPEAQA